MKKVTPDRKQGDSLRTLDSRPPYVQSKGDKYENQRQLLDNINEEVMAKLSFIPPKTDGNVEKRISSFAPEAVAIVQDDEEAEGEERNPTPDGEKRNPRLPSPERMREGSDDDRTEDGTALGKLVDRIYIVPTVAASGFLGLSVTDPDQEQLSDPHSQGSHH